MNYPIEIRSYSDMASHLTSSITALEMYFADVTTVTITAKDKLNNTLTDYGVLLRSKLVLQIRNDPPFEDFDEYIV